MTMLYQIAKIPEKPRIDEAIFESVDLLAVDLLKALVPEEWPNLTRLSILNCREFISPYLGDWSCLQKSNNSRQQTVELTYTYNILCSRILIGSPSMGVFFSWLHHLRERQDPLFLEMLRESTLSLEYRALFTNEVQPLTTTEVYDWLTKDSDSARHVARVAKAIYELFTVTGNKLQPNSNAVKISNALAAIMTCLVLVILEPSFEARRAMTQPATHAQR